MHLGNGAVYNHYITKFMDEKTDQLQSIIDTWNERTKWKRFLGHLNLFTDWGLKIEVITDIICARNNPNGDAAKKVNWRIESFRKEKR